MKRRINTNFRLGLTRKDLIEATQLFGKKEKTAKRDSTKRLEQYLMNKLGGRGTKVPSFTEREKRDIKDAISNFGLQDGLHLLAYRTQRLNDAKDESNFLRLTIGRAFGAFYDKGVRKEHIDELISRLPLLNRSDLISGISRLEPYYQQLFMDYAEELEQSE